MSVVDTNVLVHVSAGASPDHAHAHAALARLVAQGPIAVTRQSLREFLSAVTRPQSWARAATLAEATAAAEGFAQSFPALEDGPAACTELMALSRRFAFGGKHVHDANVEPGGSPDIVAAMLAHGETRLLTFNAADFRRFIPLIEVVTP